MNLKLLLQKTGFFILCLVLKQLSYSQYANTTLSNLTPPVSVNTHLTPIADSVVDLGSVSNNWRSIYFKGLMFIGTAHVLQVQQSNPNTFLGWNAGITQRDPGFASQAGNNTGIGYLSLSNDNNGGYNTGVGAYSLSEGGNLFDHPMIGNTAIGAYALQKNVSQDNTAVGAFALNKNYAGTQNVAVGGDALSSNDGVGNNALGYQALYFNTTGNDNVGVGRLSLFNNKTGNRNIAIGWESLYSNQSGNDNVAIGHQSLQSNTGTRNVAVGSSTLLFNQSGSKNIGIGWESLLSNTNGEANTAIGYNSLHSNQSGSNNISIGNQAVYNNTNGSYNVGIGWSALFNNTTNAYNVGVGLQAGYHNTQQGTFLGTYADAMDGLSNVTAIGYGAQATANNQVKIGNPAVTSIGGYANWTNFSDGRYKQNIKENVPGLDFINQLKPITYTLDIDGIENALNQKSGSANNQLSSIQPSSGSGAGVNSVPARNQTPQDIQAKQEKAKVVYTGFVAQDVEKAAKSLNYDFSGVDVPKNKNDFYGLRYSDFVIPLVKAVQELSQKNNELEERIAKLENLLNQNNASQTTTLSSASISQNEPNPFNSNSIIHYVLPGKFSNARVDFTDNLGKVIKSVSIKSSIGNITVDGSLLSGGTYQYTLVVDGKVIDTKRMAVAK